ncbi:serine/threonine protein kinase [Actinomadura rugatobispora]|uniref:Serine/threonine protein kinase n=1 Tax=Actinomadura rugatobispora TaxID=1994 RepID=A0ABW1A8U3_9ACTN|nr:hypothetical protein GCM10010200_047560 [Actinomadura rugatobispora]
MAEALPLQPGDPRGLGEYEITGRLGVGEHGAVFLGRDRSGRKVAIKLLHLRLSGEPAARDRFAGSFAAARKVSGFCVAGILDADVEGGRPYVVSEWVDGPSLLQLVAEEGPRGDAVAERLAVGTAVALAAIHRAGAVHHDFKPANVLLGRDGPRVSDVAVTPALDAVDAAPNGRVSDDPSYKAPEQLSGIDIGPAADVFAWGATLLYAVTARPPFGDDAPTEVMQRIMYDDPDLSAFPEYLRGIVAEALAKDPAGRPTPAGLLERLLDESGPLAERMPEGLVAEGRALARGTTPPQPQPQTAPAAPAAPPAAPPPPQPPERPSSTAPASFGQGAQTGGDGSSSGDPWPPEEPAELTRVDFPLPLQSAAVPPANAPVHEDAATQAIPSVHPRPQPPAQADPADRTEPTPHLIPGMGASRDEDERNSTAVLSLPPEEPRRGVPGALDRLTRLRPGNHLLGVALSLTIGVLVGVAIIALVLLPQWRDDAGGSPGPGAAPPDDRPVSAVPDGFSGTWKGTAVNPSRGASFPIEVTFTAGEKTAKAVYPRSHCTGTLTLTEGTNRQLTMALAIPKPCTNGTVQVSRQPDGTLQYAWSTPGQPQLGYQGKLTRG